MSGCLLALRGENKPHRERVSRQLHQTALFILPGEQNDEPVLQEQSNEFGIQFTEDPPLVHCSPFINTPVLLP